MNTRKHIMAYGDRIYARLCLNGKQILEFMLERVADFTQLLGELRAHTRQYRGLCRLYVRNFSRGWSFERPLMLYSDLSPHSHSFVSENIFAEEDSNNKQRPIMPWETH